MTHPKILKFSRNECINNYFNDSKTSVQFDITDGDTTIATLITNNKKSLARVQYDIELRLERGRPLINPLLFFLQNKSGKLIATFSIHKPSIFKIFKKPSYSVILEDTDQTYELQVRKTKEWNGTRAYFYYDFIYQDEIKCSIVNLKKPPFISIPMDIKLEGIIEHDEDISPIIILCFLQLMNIYIEDVFDRLS